MKIMIPATNRMRCTALAICAIAIGSTPIWAQAAQDAPPPPAQADGAPPPRGHMEERRIEMMTKHLSLTPDQVTQVRAIYADGMTQMRALHQDTTTPEADKHAQMKAIHDTQTAKIRAVLTAEQQPKFDAMVAREHERMEHHGNREGGPDAPPPPPAV